MKFEPLRFKIACLKFPREVYGYAVDVEAPHGLRLVVHLEPYSKLSETWICSHFETGAMVAAGETRMLAVRNAIDKLTNSFNNVPSALERFGFIVFPARAQS